jgi:hypothetical protein
VFIALAVLGGLFLIFHRPLLLSLGHRIAVRAAAKENLKLEFQLEGSVFTNIVIRNLRAVPTGPSNIESIDVDLARIDFGLFTLLRHGISTAIKNADVHEARIVFNPEKTPSRPPNPKKKIELPDIFPERLHITDATIIVRNRPQDFIAEHIFVNLDPRETGEIKVGKIQLLGGQTWLNLSTPATYANRNLTVRNLVLADTERFRSINLDASQIAARKLTINLDYVVDDGTISTSAVLRESQGSLETNIRIHGTNVPIVAGNKFAGLPENWMQGRIDKFDVDLTGLVSSPATWNGNISAEVKDFRQESTAFDRGVFQLTAKKGVATLQSADITQASNQFHLGGSTELPRDIHDLGRAPATFDLHATLPDLEQVTATMPQKIRGSAEVSGKINVHNSTVNGDLSIISQSIEFQDGRLENFNSAIKVSKKLAPADSDKPWFSDFVSDATMTASNLRVRDKVADSLEGSVHVKNDVVTFDRLMIKRKENEFALSGDYQLPKDFRDADQQPAKIDISINAPELADYWAPN